MVVMTWKEDFLEVASMVFTWWIVALLRNVSLHELDIHGDDLEGI